MLVISSAAMGYLASHKLSKRVLFLEQFLRFISYVETEIRYSSSLVIEIIKSYKPEKELGWVLEEFCRVFAINGDINTAWTAAFKNTYRTFGLSKIEAETVTSFVHNLGSNDIEGQMKHCRLNCDLITGYLKNAKDEKQNKSKLYFMIYASAGLCLTLSLV